MDELKGFITFYINASLVQKGSPFEGQNVLKVLSAMQEHNHVVVEAIRKEGYLCLFVPVHNESSRIEKVDFDLAHPRYVLPHVDIAQNDRLFEEIARKVEGSCE